MAQEKRCEMPNCTGAPLIKMEHESTLRHHKYHCSNPQCGRIYIIPTSINTPCELAPLASFGMLAVGVFTLNWDEIVDHGSNVVEHGFSLLDNLLS